MKSLWSELNELKRENAELKDTIEKCWEAICEANDGEFTLPQRIDSLYTSYLELSDKEYLRLVILHHIVEDNTDTMAKLRDIVFKLGKLAPVPAPSHLPRRTRRSKQTLGTHGESSTT